MEIVVERVFADPQEGNDKWQIPPMKECNTPELIIINSVGKYFDYYFIIL